MACQARGREVRIILCWLLRISVLKQGNRQPCQHFITAYLLDRWRGKGTGRAIFDAVFLERISQVASTGTPACFGLRKKVMQSLLK